MDNISAFVEKTKGFALNKEMALWIAVGGLFVADNGDIVEYKYDPSLPYRNGHNELYMKAAPGDANYEACLRLIEANKAYMRP